ncbi:hypothetical protein [Phaeobacter gallaeciensis]|uniref:hypothetical protein n=1 Tax=Phaeobacter gallaeciensis TaxID=60890 RepID=UPI000BBBC1F3|nr:hypothetical protein [Phaeobacter gallaeciensis]
MMTVPQVRLVDLAQKTVEGMHDNEKILLAVELCYCVTDQSKGAELIDAALKIARYGHTCQRISCEKLIKGTVSLPDTEFTAPLAEIPPKVGHAPEGGNGPSLRLPVAQCWDHLKRVARWLDDSWVGDLIGAICLFGIGYLLLLFGWVLS